ncbi:MAG: hypothetical protein KDA54_21765, partial [Phycisphaerales bacterium]|nr:hypothetical protein [Phycisphaerales bacterium]
TIADSARLAQYVLRTPIAGAGSASPGSAPTAAETAFAMASNRAVTKMLRRHPYRSNSPSVATIAGAARTGLSALKVAIAKVDIVAPVCVVVVRVLGSPAQATVSVAPVGVCFRHAFHDNPRKAADFLRIKSGQWGCRKNLGASRIAK